jgi:TolB protein
MRLRTLLIGGGIFLFFVVAVPVGLLIYTSSGPNPSGPEASGPNRLVFSETPTIWTINANGSNLRHVTDYAGSSEAAFGASPEWSPDGKKILFTRESEDCAEGSSSASARSEPPEGPCIFVANADGSSQKKLVDTPGQEPSLSPDGTKIAFSKDCAIYIMNSDGSGTPTKLLSPEPTSTDYCYYYPEWSPDGKKIAVVGRSYQIYVVDVSAVEGESKEPVKLTNLFSATGPAWSPDGSEIAFSGQQRGDLPSVIYKMNADGSGMTRLANKSNFHKPFTVNSMFPAWSPDGKKIAYVINNHPRLGMAIYVMNSDGSNQKLVTKKGRDAIDALDWE